MAFTLANLVNAFGALGDPKTKKDMPVRALAIKVTHYGKDHYEAVFMLPKLANSLVARGTRRRRGSSCCGRWRRAY